MPLRVIPVIDLLAGEVVHGVAGRREAYRPVSSCWTSGSAPADIAASLRTAFSFPTVYVADLDAITRQQFDSTSWREIANSGMKLMLDAGIGSLAIAQQVLTFCEPFPCRVQLVIGLESLGSLRELQRMIAVLGPEHLVFSLDLKAGQPQSMAPELQGLAPLEIAERVIQCGVHQLIVLDVASVGVAEGITTLPLCREIIARHANVQLISGGGVRGVEDLLALAAAGCEAALVASALHNGSLTPALLAKLNDADPAQ